MWRATMLVRHTRNTILHETQRSSLTKLFRMSSNNPKLPDVRHNPNVSHVPVLAKSQGKCIYCRYQHLCKKLEDPDADPMTWGVIRQPQRKCIGCGFHVYSFMHNSNQQHKYTISIERKHAH